MGNKHFHLNHLSRDLQERIKELECLYAISKIAARDHLDYKTKIYQIIREIPAGFQFPSLTQVYLQLEDITLGNSPSKKNYISFPLSLSNNETGIISVYYNDSIEDPKLFLKEEEALLGQIGHEITQIVEFEIKVRNELELKNKLKFNERLNVLSEITGGIAHEINTPLSNILGYSEILLNTEKDPQKIADLKKVINSAIHAREIVKKLMFFSCDLPTNYKLQDLNTVIKDSVNLLHLQLEEKQIELKWNLNEQPTLLKIDTFQFTQVIFNIIRNAIQAMETKGVLEISTYEKENNAFVEINDNGCGMSSSEIDHIFTPFVSGRKNKTNMGLGLSVTKNIIDAHKGHLSVTSEIGKGSTFKITLSKNLI